MTNPSYLVSKSIARQQFVVLNLLLYFLKYSPAAVVVDVVVVVVTIQY